MKRDVHIATTILLLAVMTAGWLLSPVLADQSITIDATTAIAVCGNGVKEGSEQCDTDDLAGRTCSDIGFSGGTLGCSASCEYDTAACTTVAEAFAEQEFAFTSGGTLILSDEVHEATVSLPENFHTTDLQLKAFSYPLELTSPTKPAPSGKQFVGKAYDFVFVDPSGDMVSTLSTPAVVVLSYTSEDVDGIDEDTLAPYRWGSGASSWQPVSGATVDAANKNVSFSVATFSYFALFGEPHSTPAQSVSGGGGGGTAAPSPTPTPTPTPEPEGELSFPQIKASYRPVDFNLNEGDTISATGSDDPDVYIVNEHGYKRLFLNPIIFSFYGHLGGFDNVKSISGDVRNAFPTSGLFRNCEADAEEVYAVEVSGEDAGTLHHVNMSGEQAAAEDEEFFKKVFCINNNEFNWYTKSERGFSAPYSPVTQRLGQSRLDYTSPAQALSEVLPAGNPKDIWIVNATVNLFKTTLRWITGIFRRQ